MFNPHKCPLFQWRLSFGMKLMYSSGVWSYVVGAITTPTFILIPLITIWIGVFPIIITRKFTLAATIYGASIYLLQYQVKKLWCALRVGPGVRPCWQAGPGVWSCCWGCQGDGLAGERAQWERQCCVEVWGA